MKKLLSALLGAFLFFYAGMADAAPLAPKLSGTKAVSYSKVADTANTAVTAIARSSGRVTRVYAYDLSTLESDQIKLQCGSQVKAGYYLPATSNIHRPLFPMVIECRDNSATLAGTVFTLDNDVTFTVNSTTDVVTLSAETGLVAGNPLVFKTSNTLPGGLTAGTIYYFGITSKKLYSTSASAVTDDGTTNKIDITTTGTGTHSLDGTYVLGTASTTLSTDLAQYDTIVIAGSPYTVASATAANKATISTALTADSASAQAYYRGSDDFVIIKATAATDVHANFWYDQDDN